VATPELPMKLKESYKLVDQTTGSSKSFSTIEALAKFIDTDQGLLEFPLKTDSDIEKWNAWQKRDMGKDALQIVKESAKKKSLKESYRLITPMGGSKTFKSLDDLNGWLKKEDIKLDQPLTDDNIEEWSKKNEYMLVVIKESKKDIR
jgi:hypothetical protein